MCILSQFCPTLCNPMDCSLPDSSLLGIFQQKYWSGLPVPPPDNLPDPGIKPTAPAAPELQSDSLALATAGKPRNK